MPEGSVLVSSDVSMSEESPRLSTASISSNERAPSTTPSDSDLPVSDPRPVSLVSTLSSGSRDDSLAPPPSSHASDHDVSPDLSHAGHGGEESRPRPPCHSKGWSLGLTRNNNNKELTASRASRGRQQPAPLMTGSMTPNPELSYLDRVVMEIIETERTYVRDLRMIVEDYLAHIIDCSGLSIRPEQVCSLFGNIEDIYEFNSELLQALDLCDHDPVAVARCFVMKSEYFEIYTQYCTNYPNSVAALTDCMRIKSLAKFFRERQAQLKRSLPLGSYLLKPVQRILKYHLLLQEIAKHFDPEEEGYEVVEEAIYTMTGVAWYINDMKRKHEHAVRLQEVQSLLLNWKGPDLTTYGELVLEGTFKVHRAKNERTLFLFDRVLLITKRRGEHYVYKTHISCSTLMLIENAKDSLSFSVTHYKHPKQPHTVQAKTVEEKKLWAHHIKRIILENHHAIIPQKAKDAILEMDSIYPPRYRYSPERRKKAASSQCEDGCRGRQPNNQVLKPVVRDIFQDSGGDVSSLDLNKDKERLLEKGAEATSEQLSTDELLQEQTSESGPTENAEPDFPDLEPPAISVSPQSSEELKPEGDPAPTEEPLSATPDSDSRTLSSAESSEEEEDDKKASEKEDEATSILPSSVLDKASSIAQHFTNSIKRGSATPDKARSFGLASPRSPSRTSSRTSSSLSAEPTDQPRLSSVCSDATDLTQLSPQDDSLFDADRSIQRSRDSILSKQDQLLIGKIKSYYEYAESQDATFSLQRRESLTYIPTGLVRSSVSRLDSVPKDNQVQTNPSPLTTCSGLEPSSVELQSTSPADTSSRLVSSDSLDSFKSDQRSSDPGDSEESLRYQSLQKNPSEGEEFRPSSEMIKIWKAMEQEISRSHSEAPRTSRATEAVTKIPNTCERESGVSDLRTIPEELTSPSTPKQKPSDVTCTGSLKVFREEAVVLRAPGLRVTQLRDSSKDTDNMKSKVQHLARQYSQRIKTTKPELRQPSQGVSISKKSLPCVLEETEGSGKSDLTLALVSQLKASSVELSPTDQIQPPTSILTSSSGMASMGPAPSSSPLTPPIEGFNWPDVRELRSKYSDQKSPVGRSHSTTEQMFDGGVRRRSSCSSSPFFAEGASGEGRSYRTRRSQDARRRERSKRLHRAKSLDPQLSGLQMSELQNLNDQENEAEYDGYFVAAETTLPNDSEHKITVMEKLPEPESQETASISKEEEEENYVQIRSPTSREKISIMAVIDRCRAYQESDEYKQRDEAKSKTLKPQELDKSLTNQDEESKTTNAGQKTEVGHQSIVKNLREKFQSLS
ncbi:pleckstrin homology domain-containing family G member 3-like [Limanda limanda]|uniref:pleckstrin homology domain-containing family G member 3-like n=1 Tax=Limanda limanda TaxID=27771 RepID=UPI0029C8997B|nr:pleckstrin homology domain-containing family G member 3-like [Limanda limanda]XP_060947092.1 pleckstrin homology domain-containing family G member 3-like [Limanda limanda]XP_060947093.1 pleckstrin homology domain-containing family G member 3-like [Limanda limanda]